MIARQAIANRHGVLFMLGAMATFSFSDFMVKLAAQRIGIGELMTIRGVMSLALLGVVFALRPEPSVGQAFRSRPALLRSALEAGVSVSIIAALAVLPLGDCAVVPQTAPLLLTFYLMATGGERRDATRLALVVVGLIGVVLIVKPTGSFQPEMLYLVASALLIAGRDLATRGIPRHISSLATTMVTTVANLVTGVGLSAAQTWTMPDLPTFGALFGSAVALTAGYLCTIAAFREAEPSVVAPFRYTGVLYALVIGYFAFGHLPDASAAVGIACIVAAGVASILRERARARVEKAAAASA